MLAIDIGRTVRRVQLSAYAQTQLTLYENKRGFRAGNRLLGGIQAGGLVYDRLMVLAGLDLIHDRPERWNDIIRQDGFLGRTELLGGLTLVHPFGMNTVSLTMRVPLYRHIIACDEEPGTLSSPLVVSIAASRALGNWQ